MLNTGRLPPPFTVLKITNYYFVILSKIIVLFRIKMNFQRIKKCVTNISVNCILGKFPHQIT